MADGILLGYGGSAIIQNVQVLVTSGSFDTAMSISYLTPMDIPPTFDSRTRVVHADGVKAYTGSVAVDVTENFLTLLDTDDLFKRRYCFDVSLFDGVDGYTMENVYLTSMTLSGSPGGIITASLSFTGPNEWQSDTVTHNFIRDEEPLAYWWSGNTDVSDWTLTLNQDVQPVYSNEDTMDPRYMRIGLWDFSLDVSTYETLRQHEFIVVKTKKFTLTGNTSSEGYSYNGATSIGTYKHVFESGALAADGSSGSVIAIGAP